MGGDNNGVRLGFWDKPKRFCSINSFEILQLGGAGQGWGEGGWF